jgi:UDP-N-acetylmuramoyl-L-alanyl-D-glutamate--2,6-diaminopimelate ligase
MANAGVDSVSMEVSSHALDQHRVYGIAYRGAIFTNLTRDHLDYHGTIENYAKSKKRLFDGLSDDAIAVLWGESEWASYMKRHCNARRVVMVGTGPGNHVQVTDVSLSVSGTSFVLRLKSADLEAMPEVLQIRTKLLGDFNVANVALVAVLAILDGVAAERVAEIVPNLTGPKGRMEVHSTSKGTTAIVDYAHSPDALDNVLRVVREFASSDHKNRRVHVVFGCGGDRDKGKRAEMGRIASTLADHVYITSDNPRTEQPREIINNIMGGVDATLRSKVAIIEDRRSAIECALTEAAPEDVVVIAGKGHEECQIIGAERHPFSDFDEVSRWSAKHKKAPL